MTTDPYIRRLAELVSAHDKRLNALGRGPQLAYSSIEDGAINEYESGQHMAAIGLQFDGTHVAATLSGPTPPQASTPICEGGAGILTVRWDGEFATDGVSDLTIFAPMDFSRVEVHASTTAGFTADMATTLKGVFSSPRGGEQVIALDEGVWYVKLVTRAYSGKAGAESLAGSATVSRMITEAEMAAFEESVAADLLAADGRLADAETAVATAVSDAAEAERRAGLAETAAGQAKTAGEQAAADAEAAATSAGTAAGKATAAEAAAADAKTASTNAANAASTSAVDASNAASRAQAAETAAGSAQTAATAASGDADAAAASAATASQKATAAESAATAAKSAGDQAALDADAAAGSAASALTRAQNAEASAGTAQTAASNAATDADAAAASASSALTRAQNAESAASAAQTAAGNARTDANAAATSASNAATRATAAETAATNAKAAGDQAALDADAAAGSASTAATKATNAETAASDAKTAATNSANSASASATSASSALTRAQNAEASASAASTAAGTAASEADAAATAAQNADSRATSAESAANQAVTDAGTAKSQAASALSAASSAESAASAAQTASGEAKKAVTDLTAVVDKKTTLTTNTAAPGTAVGTTIGDEWRQVDASGKVIGIWTWMGATTKWVTRPISGTILQDLHATNITSGTLSTARLDAAAIRTHMLSAGKIAAGDIVAGTLTSASGVFGTLDASVLNAGTLSTARLNAGDLRAHVLSAGKITAGDIVTGTLTSASGVFGTVDASIINAGTLNAARLNAADVRAKFIAAGKVTAADIVAGTLTSASGVFGTLDASIINAGTLAADRIGANSINATKLAVGDFANLYHDPKFELGVNISAATIYEGTAETVPNGRKAISINGRDHVGSRYVQVEAGQTYRFTFVGKNISTGTAKLTATMWVRTAKGAGAGVGWSGNYYLLSHASALKVIEALPNGWNRYESTTKIPAAHTDVAEGSLYFQFEQYPTTTPNTQWLISDITWRRMNGGELIVDGGITANNIKAASLTSASGIFGTMDASVLNAGTLNADRLNASDIRTKFLTAGKITAADIVASTLTSASGVFGTMDASVINAGVLNADRLDAATIRAKFLTAGKITAGDVVAGTLTSASGVFGTLDASVINAGVLAADRLDAATVRAKFLTAGKITAGDIVTGTLTSASGVFGTVDASVINAGTLNADRLDAATVRAKFLTAGKITANDLVASTLTSASGVFGTMNASIINAGTLAADRLDAATVRAKFIAAGKITAADITASTLTSASGVFGTMDASVLNAGTLAADRIGANSINATKIAVGDFTNLATIDELNGVTVNSYGQTKIVSGWNALVDDAGSFFMFRNQTGPVPFRPGEKVHFRAMAKATADTTAKFGIWVYNSTGNRNNTSPDVTITAAGGPIEGVVTVPGDATFGPATQYIIGMLGVTNKGIQVKEVFVRRQTAGELIVDGAITATQIKASSLTSASGIFGTMDASVLNAGTLNADRLDAATVRAKFLTAGKITAADITASTLTSASGIFGTMDASVINAGTINAARLNASDIRTKFLAAGKITAADIVASTLTSASGVFGTMDASVINAGTISTARLSATDLRAHILTAGKITTADLTATAIDGMTITGALIQSAAAANTGIKLTNSQLVAYASDGTETLRLDGANNIITGAVYRTAPTGARVQLDASGLQAWDANNSRYLLAGSAGLEVTGRFKSGAEGATVEMKESGVNRRPMLVFNTQDAVAAHGGIEGVGPNDTGYSMGQLVVRSAEDTLNSSGRAELALKKGGDFRLASTWGPHGDMGIHGVAGDLRILGPQWANGKPWARVNASEAALYGSTENAVRVTPAQTSIFGPATFEGNTVTAGYAQVKGVLTGPADADGFAVWQFGTDGRGTVRNLYSSGYLAAEQLRTSVSGRGLVIQQDSVGAPALFFTTNGVPATANPALFADQFNNVVLRGRGNNLPESVLLPSGARVSNFLEIYDPPTSTFTANLGIASSPKDRIYKLTSRRDTKVNIRDYPAEKTGRILDLNPRIWYDRTQVADRIGAEVITEDAVRGPQVPADVIDAHKTAHKAGEPVLREVPGLVAEEVAAAGLDDYVTYADDPDTGEARVEGVAYDRLWTLLIPEVRAMGRRITDLETEVATLKGAA